MHRGKIHLPGPLKNYKIELEMAKKPDIEMWFSVSTTQPSNFSQFVNFPFSFSFMSFCSDTKTQFIASSFKTLYKEIQTQNKV